MPRARLRSLLALGASGVLVALSSGGCSFVLAPDDGQCESNADCEARGGDFVGSICVERACIEQGSTDPRWACLGKVEWPTPEPTPVKYVSRIQELISAKPPANLTVKACDRLDVACTSPIAPETKPDADGLIVLMVPAGFTGFLEMLSDDTVPSYLFNSVPIFEETDATDVPINLLTPGTFNLLATSGGFEVDPAFGTTLILTRDCTDVAGPGIIVETASGGPKTQQFYLVDGLPSTTATETAPDGQAGFLNLPPGYVTLVTKIAATGERIGDATIQIRAGSITYTDIAPTP